MTGTELEGQLVAMLRRRAADISTAPPIALEPAGRRPGRRWLAPLAVAAAVVAVLLMVGGTVVGIRSIHHPTSVGGTGTPTTTVPSPSPPDPNACTIALPRSWQQAITDGRIALDHLSNEVISVDRVTGEYLVRQLRPQPTAFGQSDPVTLALFDGKTGQDIAIADPGTEPVADGSGAINADWIVYGLHRLGDNSGYSAVVLHDRRTGHDQVLDRPSGIGNEFVGNPVLFGGKVYWLQVNFDQNRSAITSYDLSSGVSQTRPLAGPSVGLLYYGTGLAIQRPSIDGTLLMNYLGTPLGRAALAAAAHGVEYPTFDGVTLRWWSTQQSDALYSMRPGSAKVDRIVVPGGSPGDLAAVPTWPFVPAAGWYVRGGTSGLWDLRTNALVMVPWGMSVQAVSGETVLIGTDSGLSLVRLDQLPPARC